MVTNPGSETSHPFHDRGEICLYALRTPNSKLIGITQICNNPRGTDDSFGGDASHIEAVAAQEVPFHKGDLRPQTGCTSGCD